MDSLHSWPVSVGIQVFGSGPPLVFFHGFGFDSSIWQELIDPLKDTYQLYLVDLPGFGYSSKMTWAWFQAELLVRLPPKFNLLGWSLGGLYATRLALEAPNRVTKLMNLCSSPYFMAERDWPGIKRHEFKAFKKQLTDQPEQFLTSFRRKETTACRCFNLVSSSMPELEVLEESLAMIGTWDFRQQLGSLEMPVTYVFAGMDSIVPSVVYDEFLKRFPGISAHRLNDATHLLFLSNKKQFLNLLKQFF